MVKVAFIRVFSSHPILVSLENLLKNSFPEYELETITVTDLLRRRADILAPNSLEVLRVYCREVVRDPTFFTRRFLRTPYMFRKVRQLIRSYILRNRAEYAFSFSFQSLFDASTPGLPHFIYTDHTYQESQKSALRIAPYSAEWAELEREIYENADGIFTWSSNISRSLIHDYGIPAEKVVCAYTGPNMTLASHTPEEHNYSNKNVLFVGSDWDRKGGPVLVEAFRRVQEVIPDAQLTVIGPAPPVDLPNSQFLGRLPIDELEGHFRRASVFCLPTRREPFGNVFVDAMQAALPIVATNIEALPDVVKNGENGFLVEPDDVAALAEALSVLLSDPEKCRQFGMRSHQLWKERYNWENVGAIMRATILRGAVMHHAILHEAIQRDANLRSRPARRSIPPAPTKPRKDRKLKD